MRVKKNDNRGFTLVELIVSMAILGIVAMGACAFMVAATRSYSSMNYAVRLQYEAQLAMAQLQEYIVDCSAGIAWDTSNSTLYIVNNPPPGAAEEEGAVGGAKKTVHVFTYMPDTAPDPDPDPDPDAVAPLEPKTISYGTGIAAGTLDVTADELCAKHVDSMTVKLKPRETQKRDIYSAWEAEITLVMSRKNKTYTATQAIALRNLPIMANSWDELWDDMNG